MLQISGAAIDMIGVFFILLLWAMPAMAANPYNMGKVEYFPTDKSVKKKVVAPLDWREPVTDSSGHMSYHVPPPPVIRLLNDPTPQNARAYLDWQRQRMERTLKAQTVLAQLQGEAR